MGNTQNPKMRDPENGKSEIYRNNICAFRVGRKMLIFYFCCFLVQKFLTDAKEKFNEKWEKPSHVSRWFLSKFQGCCSLKQTKGGLLDEIYS